MTEATLRLETIILLLIGSLRTPRIIVAIDLARAGAAIGQAAKQLVGRHAAGVWACVPFSRNANVATLYSLVCQHNALLLLRFILRE